MRTTASLTVMLLLFACNSGAGADKPNNDRDPWNGFGVGSWAILSESFTRGDKTETHREKQTWVSADLVRHKKGHER